VFFRTSAASRLTRIYVVSTYHHSQSSRSRVLNMAHSATGITVTAPHGTSGDISRRC
jgi:hypothetical protein